MATESPALLVALLVFVACFVWFVRDQRRVDNPVVNPPPGPPVFRTTINLPPSPLDPVLISLFQRFDVRLSNFELETGARLNQATLTEAFVRQIRGRIAFLQNYSHNIDNPVAERTQAASQAEILVGLLVYTEGLLTGLRYGLPHPTI